MNIPGMLPFALDFKTYSVVGPQGRQPLTPTEYRLLDYLLRQRYRVVSRADLEHAALAEHRYISRSTLKTHLHHVRRKLDRVAPGSGRLIRTRIGFGYGIMDAA